MFTRPFALHRCPRGGRDGESLWCIGHIKGTQSLLGQGIYLETWPEPVGHPNPLAFQVSKRDQFRATCGHRARQVEPDFVLALRKTSFEKITLDYSEAKGIQFCRKRSRELVTSISSDIAGWSEKNHALMEMAQKSAGNIQRKSTLSQWLLYQKQSIQMGVPPNYPKFDPCIIETYCLGDPQFQNQSRCSIIRSFFHQCQ